MDDNALEVAMRFDPAIRRSGECIEILRAEGLPHLDHEHAFGKQPMGHRRPLGERAEPFDSPA
jgi:hypothetical protein